MPTRDNLNTIGYTEPLDKAILKTFVWFDLFDFPLTSWEVYKYLWTNSNDISFRDIIQVLKYSKCFSHKDRFYFLNGREEIVHVRKKRAEFAERKFNKALRILKKIRLLPWIRMIAVCNRLGYNNATDDSDIDLLIITQRNRLWITRLFVVGFLKLFKQRPTLERFSNKQENRRDKLDAGFFINEQQLNISSIALTQDVDLAYWITHLVPIYDTHDYYEKFFNENSWIKQFIPYTTPIIPPLRRIIVPAPSWTQRLDVLHTLLPESFYSWFQLLIMPKKTKNQANKNTSIVINENMLKFHDQDKREFHRELWMKKNSRYI